MQRRSYFDATLNQIEAKGGNTFATIKGYFAKLPQKNLMGGATLTTTVGVGGVTLAGRGGRSRMRRRSLSTEGDARLSSD